MEYIDVHTHSRRGNGIFVQNIFAQDLTDHFVPEVFCSIGFHPWHIEQYPAEKMITALKTHAGNKLVLAIGECGLDKNIPTTLSDQEKIFLAQLQIAEFVSKPVIIHCVKAYTEIIKLRKSGKWKVPWLFHWFHSSYEVAMELIELGCYLSFGRSLLKPDGKNAGVFAKLPMDRLFLETDDANVSIEELYQRAVQFKEIKRDELSRSIRINFNRLFGI